MSNLKNQPSNRLEIAESASLIASAAGTICAAILNQAIFAAAPLTVALSLNFINRQRLQTQTTLNTKNTNAAISYVERQLRSEVESVRAQMRRLPAAERLREMEESIVRLALLWTQIQQRMEETNTPLNEAKIQEEFLILRRAILRLRDTSNAHLSEIQNNLQNEIDTLRQTLPPSAINPETQIDENLENEPVLTQIQQLQERIEQLEQKNQKIIKPFLKRLVIQVKKLQQQSNTDALAATLSQLITHLENLAKELETQIDPQQVKSLQTALSKLSENLPDRQPQQIQTQRVRGWE
ncbi:hypothetical protein NG798_10670 [Ancylothrix sp. C2]|uniref:hypothetical protein n=1 Tax=Ancylothrix sp. D3o TaxID=2953691 RepID=UPI0021BB3F9F|nr:hypothetical protein [Ancylothrix sp. D3o]MCT7950251.1 hypothetical protein [Ancylothrix sp. D3o]